MPCDMPLAAVAHLPSYHRGAPAMVAIIRSVRAEADATATEPAAVDSLFDGNPAVSVTKFMARLTMHSDVSPSTFVVMFLLIDRWAFRNPLTSRVLHHVMATAFLLAMYIAEDEPYTHSEFAAICSIDSKELGGLALEFLRMIEYNLSVPVAHFARTEALLLSYPL
eukprot:TRINITY_DN55198_c0_g1_i1.p1 TRINITY_DN55198_c0_g1~~TRINITY_DN55198_c0_g1_i1.p1  ORF type:complete len:192 (+),score=48.25 TRINITY_DN55198_c0_g1_i1:79-576(+)